MPSLTRVTMATIMATPNVLLATCRQLAHAYRGQLWLWLLPTLIGTGAALGFAMMSRPTWKASQALVVRDQAIGNLSPQARFTSAETMKAFQETILEVARSRSVVLESLKVLGPPAERSGSKPWPSESDIDGLQGQISVSAPKGSVFGSTEVIYLFVEAGSRQEAIDRARVVCDQLEKRLSELRNARAASVISELEGTLDLAQTELDKATKTLAAMEREVGPDLGELRMLNDSGSGDSNLRTALNQVKAELRQVQTAHEANQQLRKILLAAKDDADSLLTIPTRLLDSQPILRRLKDGLADAQLRTSSLRGRMTSDHPSVVAAVRAEEEVRQNIAAELSAALQTIAADLQVSEQQLRLQERQQEELQGRLDRLAGLRAQYSNLVGDARQRSDIVQQAQRNLAEARAGQSAASSTSLLTRFQTPIAGDSPEGPGGAMMVAGGLFGGFLAGSGLVFLTLPSGPTLGRRWSDLLHLGRRASDRSTTVSAASQPQVGGRRIGDPAAAQHVKGREQLSAADRRRGRGRRADDGTGG
jgi:uncharacterized protein involved in exopolysaccharide biosynthesis